MSSREADWILPQNHRTDGVALALPLRLTVAFALAWTIAAPWGCSGKKDSKRDPRPGSSSPSGAPSPRATPRPKPEQLKPASPVKQLALGGGFAAALLENGSVYYWGHWIDNPGQAAPRPVLTPFRDAVRLGAASTVSYLCMVSKGGKVSCRSRAPSAIGKGWIDTWAKSARIEPPTKNLGRVTHVAPGNYEGCALLADRTVHCWSTLRKPVLIRPKLAKKLVKIPGLTRIVQLGVGAGHACALRDDGSVWCWGENNWDSLGSAAYGEINGKFQELGRKVAMASGTRWRQLRRVAGLARAEQLAVSSFYSCVLQKERVWCWGGAPYSGPGAGSSTDRAKPRPVPGVTRVKTIAAGADTACALIKDGTVTCWGHDLKSHTYGPKKYRRAPHSVPGLKDATSIAVGKNNACAVRKNGSVACWGSNRYGQLGDGKRRPSSLTHVVWPSRP